MRLATAFSDVDALDLAGPHEVLDGLHGEVGVDGGGTEADEQGHVVDLAHVAGLDEQAHLGAGLLADEVVVDGSREQQRRDRREVAAGVAVGEHDEAGSVGDRLRHLGEDLLEAVAHGGRSPGDVVEAADDVGGVAGQVAVGVDVHDLGELVVVDDGEVEDELAGVRGDADRALPSGPMKVPSEVTSSSRIASSGGLVTWAKSWVK